MNQLKAVLFLGTSVAGIAALVVLLALGQFWSFVFSALLTGYTLYNGLAFTIQSVVSITFLPLEEPDDERPA